MKVLNIYEIGIDGPVACIQCRERYCDCCPERAISIGSLGQVIVSATLCTVCGVCEIACPIGAIEIFNDIVYVCDLCGGRPRCIEACTEGAIRYETGAKTSPSLADLKKKTKRMNPSQKRYFYLKNLSSEVRTKWRRGHA
jgi:Fe-S-cluster-containing hydrogenase component 2